jgi:CrcB protein
MVKQILLVGIGGSAGSMFRYILSYLITKHLRYPFPLGTFAVNMLGCLLAGFLFGFFSKQFPSNNELKLIFIAGFCGGFTTFSAFALENVRLLQAGNTLMALAYIVCSILLGLFAVWLGFGLAK